MKPAYLIFSFIFICVIAALLVTQRPVPVPAPAVVAPVQTPIATVREVMSGIVDPTSSVLFNAVAESVGDGGPIETAPKNDEEWAVVANNALSLAEAGNLLKVAGRHVAATADLDKRGDDPAALLPREIEAKIAADPAAWGKYVDGLTAVSVEAWKMAKAHDKDGLFKVGGEIDGACESCHLKYWYPNQKIPDVPAS